MRYHLLTYVESLIIELDAVVVDTERLINSELLIDEIVKQSATNRLFLIVLYIYI